MSFQLGELTFPLQGLFVRGNGSIDIAKRAVGSCLVNKCQCQIGAIAESKTLSEQIQGDLRIGLGEIVRLYPQVLSLVAGTAEVLLEALEGCLPRRGGWSLRLPSLPNLLPRPPERTPQAAA